MGAEHDDRPNIEYHGTAEQFDAFQKKLKDKLEGHLKDKKISEQLIKEAQALLTEALMEEIATERIAPGTMEVVLGLDEENRKLIFGFRPPPPQVKCNECEWTGDADDCPPSLSIYSDLRCPKCGTTNLDTSDVNKKLADYGFGDDNSLRMKKDEN